MDCLARFLLLGDKSQKSLQVNYKNLCRLSLALSQSGSNMHHEMLQPLRSVCLPYFVWIHYWWWVRSMFSLLTSYFALSSVYACHFFSSFLDTGQMHVVSRKDLKWFNFIMLMWQLFRKKGDWCSTITLGLGSSLELDSSVEFLLLLFLISPRPQPAWNQRCGEPWYSEQFRLLAWVYHWWELRWHNIGWWKLILGLWLLSTKEI